MTKNKSNHSSHSIGDAPSKAHQYYIVYKPFQVLSQFTSHEGKKTLRDFYDVPQDVYPVGRLDYDSEGLLILSNDKTLNHRLLNPVFAHEREYWVQVEGIMDGSTLQKLQSSVIISVDGKAYKTKRCVAKPFTADPGVATRNPPIRFRKNIPTSWIRLTLTEGKNRQVRKMCASVGFPVLRLIRYRIEKINIEGLQPGEMRKLGKEEVYRLLSLAGHAGRNDN